MEYEGDSLTMSTDSIQEHDEGVIQWRQILQHSTQVVLYNPTSHALTIRPAVVSLTTTAARSTIRERTSQCPYCHRSLSEDEDSSLTPPDTDEGHALADGGERAPNYFQLLQIANEVASRPSTPPPSIGDATSTDKVQGMAEGYFHTFFKEEMRLGMGAGGSVFLCQHMLNGNPLGHFAVKKIAIGQSHDYLLQILREVRLLEQLRHPNIVAYHHAWIESCQFSSFGPRIPTLHILMQWAEAGSLDDFLSARLGHSKSHGSVSQPDGDELPDTRSARIRAFRAAKAAHANQSDTPRRQEGTWKAVHLLGANEVNSLLRDVVDGLAFLHGQSILHLDLKPGNILLTSDQGRLIPRAMLCDFGTSRDMMASLTRTGNTGTLEYAAPESISRSSGGVLRPAGSSCDMWSLGMVLHRLLFLRLPYQTANREASAQGKDALTGPERLQQLEREVLNYQGFRSNSDLIASFDSRHLPRAYLILLEGLLHLDPVIRPTCDRVLKAFQEGRFVPPEKVPQNAVAPLTSDSRGRPSSPPRQMKKLSFEREDSVEAKKRLSPTPTFESNSANLRPPAVSALSEVGLRTSARRLVKSCVLVGKIWTISRVTQDSSLTGSAQRIGLAIFAIMDASTDSWRASLVTGLIHLTWLLVRYSDN